MGDWPILSDGGLVSAVGVDTANSRGTAVAPGSPSNTKGNYAQLIASSPRGDWLAISIGGATGFAGNNFLIDIAIGAAGFEIIILSNLLYVAQQYHPSPTYYLFPLNIPSGVRLSARCQTASASGSNIYVSAHVFADGFMPSSALSQIITLGAVPASTAGTSMTSGAANTKGAWSEITAAVASSIRFMVANFCGWTNNSGNKLIDIGIGSAGSEIVVVPNLFGSADSPGNPYVASFPVNIPAGTRIAARFQDSSGASKVGQVILYGLA